MSARGRLGVRGAAATAPWLVAPWLKMWGGPTAAGAKTPEQLNEVNVLVLGDWQRLARELPPETPVIFRYDGKKPMETEEYCDGLRVYPSKLWDGYNGWQPCILVELGECF